MPNVAEILHKKDKYMFFLLGLDGKHVECASSWVPEQRTLRFEMSCMFGCLCDCSHCEYSYIYNGDVSLDHLEEQFELLKETSINYWRNADTIVVSFCRMGEPTMNDDVMRFFRRLWNFYRHERRKFIFEIPTVAPEIGAKLLLEAKKFAAVEKVTIRPVVTINAISEIYRANVTGLEMIPTEKLAFLLTGWQAKPTVLLQPVETGYITSWDVEKYFENINLSYSWRHLYGSIPITLRNHKIVSHRGNYGNHVKFVSKALKEKCGITPAPYDKPLHGISYPENLDPGQFFSLLMKENLVRAVAHYKAVS